HALQIGAYLKSGLETLAAKFPIIGDIRGQGLFIGFELVDEKLKPLNAETRYLVNRMLSFGILMGSDGPDDNVIKIKPPLIFSKSNADEVLFYLEKVLSEDYMRQYR
ncbi:MAG: aminotransferase class III-fold pyridoxal phosphate-dependent enzyme, partial [Flavobacteriaceae bacterium]|nr:aminotransferase class III-fold pyridoxal phosphate-dependent enzyme [Flavobacteriaceae bacterium]